MHFEILEDAIFRVPCHDYTITAGGRALFPRFIRSSVGLYNTTLGILSPFLKGPYTGGFLFSSQFAYFPRVMSSGLFLAALALGAGAQELYITANGTSARPHCTAKVNSPSYFFQPFSYTLNETVRYVVGLR